MSRFSERRYQQKMAKYREQVIAARIKAGPPLPAGWTRYELYAARLVDIGPGALGEHRAEVVEIGELLNAAGGMALMRAVIHRADSLSLQAHGDTVLRGIEMAWGGIGDWRG
jgi:hypothetical protein